jgi:uncharacterized protein
MLAALVILAYAGAIVYLKVNERAFVFIPDDRIVQRPSAELQLGEERVTYPSTGGITVSAWTIPAHPTPSSGMWMLICHGNFGNIGFGRRPQFYSFMREVGVNLLAFDYRGYGESTGEPEEQGLYDDARASYDYLVNTRHVRPDQIVIFGHSLGSAMAIELASHVPAAALIVEGAFTSVLERGQEIYPLLPIRLVSTQRFLSIDRIQSIEMPKLFLHSPEDAVIPFAHGRRLFDTAREPKRFVSVRGGHDDAYRVDREAYFRAIADWISTSTR